MIKKADNTSITGLNDMSEEKVKMRFTRKGNYPSKLGYTNEDGINVSVSLIEGLELTLPNENLAFQWWKPVVKKVAPVVETPVVEAVVDNLVVEASHSGGLDILDNPEQISNEEALRLEGVTAPPKKTSKKKMVETE